MVTLELNGNKITVPNGAVKLYEGMGYREVGNAPVFTAPAVIEQKPVKDVYSENLEEKPITLWTKDELKEYARENNIDLSGTKSANEAREIIKDYINQK